MVRGEGGNFGAGMRDGRGKEGLKSIILAFTKKFHNSGILHELLWRIKPPPHTALLRTK